METVYQVLEEGKVGILESPTGTVSSCSLYVPRDPPNLPHRDNFKLISPTSIIVLTLNPVSS